MGNMRSGYKTSSYQSSLYPPGPQGQRQATVALFLHGSSQGFNENLWGFAHINGLTRAAVVMIVAYSGRGCWTRARPQNSSKNIGHILQYSRGSGCLLAGWGTNHCYCCCCCWWWWWWLHVHAFHVRLIPLLKRSKTLTVAVSVYSLQREAHGAIMRLNVFAHGCTYHLTHSAVTHLTNHR